MVIMFEKVGGMVIVKGDDWYEYDKYVVLGSITRSEEDSYYYFQPSGYILEYNQIKKICDKVYELNYAEFIEPLEITNQERPSED